MTQLLTPRRGPRRLGPPRDAVADSAPSTATNPTSPPAGWRRTFADSFAVTAAMAAVQVISAVNSYLLRYLLDPAAMGVWQGLKLCLRYGEYANPGVARGAIRELTIARGRDDAESAAAGLNLAFTVNTVSSLLYAAAMAGGGAWVLVRGAGEWSGAWGAGLLVVAVLVVLQRFATFHIVILRAMRDFATPSRLSILEAALGLAVGGALVWLWGLPGLFVSTTCVLLATVVYLLPRRGATLRWQWSRGEFWRLLSIGGPIMLADLAASLFRSLDRLMILGYATDREYALGCYSLALLVTTQVYGLADVLAIVMGPRYGELFGATGSRGAVARVAARCSEWQGAIVALSAGLALVSVPAVLAHWLPAHAEGLAPLAWLIPGIVAQALAIPAAQYLTTVNQQRRALAATIVSLGVAAAGNHLALTQGGGLAGVALATTVAYVCHFAALAGLSLWGELSSRERGRYVVGVALAVGPALAAALLCEHVWPLAERGWSTVPLKLAVVAAAWSGSAFVGWRWGGWGEVWRRKL